MSTYIQPHAFTHILPLKERTDPHLPTREFTRPRNDTFSCRLPKPMTSKQNEQETCCFDISLIIYLLTDDPVTH